MGAAVGLRYRYRPGAGAVHSAAEVVLPGDVVAHPAAAAGCLAVALVRPGAGVALTLGMDVARPVANLVGQEDVPAGCSAASGVVAPG